MSAQIRPNRLDVTDRFPMLGFTIRTDGPPQRAEVVIAANPDLFRPEHKGERTPANFYSSRSGGPVLVPRGEALYTVPAEVLARFIGQERIYFGLATVPESNGSAPRVDVLPDTGSPYIQLRGLTSRSLRRVRLIPSRQDRVNGYGNGQGSLEWAGDKTAMPAAAPSVNGNGKNGTSAAAPAMPAPHDDYNDGFGPMEPPPTTSAAKPNGNEPMLMTPPPQAPAGSSSAMPATPAAAASYRPVTAQARALESGPVTISGDRKPVDPPSVTRLPSWQAALVEGALTAFSGPMAPAVLALRAAARVAGVSIGVGPAVSGGLGAGVGLGAGIVFGPDGGLGLYGAAEFEVGFLASISATGQVTVVGGGIEAFNGWGQAASISAGEGIVGGASALFDLNGNFQGVSLQLGVGAGLTPVDVYYAVQRGVAVQLAYVKAQGRAMAVRAMSDAAGDDAERMQSIDEPIPDDTATAVAAATLGYSHTLGETSEYPQASRFAPAAPSNYRHVTGTRAINRVVIHITDGGAKTSGTVGWFQNTNQTNANGKHITVSAHYVVGQDGEVVQMVHHNDVAWHAGTANGDSIGIEHCANKRGLNPTEPQYEASAALVRFLCDTYGIPVDRDHILGHKEADPSTTHDCPSHIWDWDHHMQLIVDQVCEPPAAATTQSVRPVARAKALGGQSFSINWDEVEAIPQPTEFSCWAAAAAMVVGWKEQVSLAPETIGTICSRTTASGLDPKQVGQFANEIGLKTEPPQSYSVEGFCRLLENYGPLWVGASVPGLHAIVVTGFYSDGVKSYVRITDPWDRTVGVPGAPGPYQATHVTGSRYILTWEDFVKEYEAAATDYSDIDLQILHADSSAGRTPNRGSAVSAGYAQSLSARMLNARTLGSEAFSVNWDDVESIPQPTDMGCWATAAAMVVGWRDQVCLTPESIAQICGRATEFKTDAGLDISQVGQFARELGLTAENPQCYNVEGFRRLLERNGPLWVGSAVPFLHAIVVTGVYSDGTNAYVRITDPLDRTVGTPGAQGPYASPPTHMTGSRYIMKYEDFTTEYETWGALPTATMQILHSGGAFGRTPNYGSAKGAGYAQALRQKRAVMAKSAGLRLRGSDAIGSDFAGKAATGRRRETGSTSTARWALDQYDGLRSPSGLTPDGAATPASTTIVLDQWPVIRLREGDVKLPLTLTWSGGGGVVGDVTLSTDEPMLVPGWSISATADITDGPDTATNAALTVAIRQVFSRTGKPDIVASTQLVLSGDGTYQRQDGWVSTAAA